MYEKFSKFVGRRDLPNDFYQVRKEEIVEAETKMGLCFPEQLRQFFLEVGSGFYRLGARDKELNHRLINRIINPAAIADLVCDPDDPWRPHVELYPGEMPFFDIGDRDYLLLNALSDKPNQVLWQGGSIMLDSVVEFFDRLYDHADFYIGGPDTM